MHDAINYENAHKHSYYTNPIISDSVVSYEDYAKRAVELNQTLLSSCEHGFQGRYIETFEVAKKYGLKFLFAVEAYWVKDRKEKDNSNCHIFIAAKNENGRQAINDILSEANISGFYFRPRIDVELILSLPPEDVWITTACVAFWKYEDIEDVVIMFHNHFKDNFFLEVQYHNTSAQKELNQKILTLKNRHNIQIIMGCDSHYIFQEEEKTRKDYLYSKEIVYEDEEGWYLDYPTAEIAFTRFIEQKILSREEIEEAMKNTLIFQQVEEYDNPCFNKEIKCPTLYHDKTQEEKNEIYRALVEEKWNEYKANVDEKFYELYEAEIMNEVESVSITNTADYFLVDEAIVRKGKENGGVITPTGRGSGVSFITNMLLGFTDVDRVAAKVKMYPERFMSATRILEAKTLPDLDLNLGTVEPFARAQKEIMGDDHAYPMIAYGKNKQLAAWKMYAKSQEVDAVTANEVSKQLKKYEKALGHADDEHKEFVLLEDYLEDKYIDIYNDSIQYQKTIASWSIAPCSYLLYQKSIRREIGLIRIKDNLCCLMDGAWAEDYKFLKNDLLKVAVVDLNDRIYKSCGVQKHTVSELLNICTPDNKAWSIYKRGCTVGINQVEQPGTANRVGVYAPTNISELCAFIAAIRPGFKSMYKIFEQRKPFKYNIKSIDELIQTDEMPNSFMLYQEMSMAILNYSGIPMSECYEIIKNISKKRIEKVLKYKEQFMQGIRQKVEISKSYRRDLYE